jgi:hypothetical protein
MKWTILWFGHQVEQWKKRSEQSQLNGKKGHESYAEKQVAIWEEFREKAQRGFSGMMIA